MNGWVSSLGFVSVSKHGLSLIFCFRFSVETKKCVQNIEQPRYDYKLTTNHIEKYGRLKMLELGMAFVRCQFQDHLQNTNDFDKFF